VTVLSGYQFKTLHKKGGQTLHVDVLDRLPLLHYEKVRGCHLLCAVKWGPLSVAYVAQDTAMGPILGTLLQCSLYGWLDVCMEEALEPAKR
jgi:hypothetical protein